MNRLLSYLLTVFLPAVMATLALGCGGEGAKTGREQQAGGGEGAPAAQVGPVIENPATITGTIRFTGTAPEPVRIDMSEEPACAEKHPQGAYKQIVKVNPDGTLQDVFIYVKTGLPADLKFPTPTEVVVIDQDGCRYHPHVMGIQLGQSLEIRNSDPLLHNINAKPVNQRGFNISQPVKGMKTTRRFSAPEVMVPVECDVHGWMSASIGVLEHPYFDTTGEEGTFTLDNLPPGEYVIEVWHEALGTQTQTVTVGAGETKTVEFTFGTTA